MYYLRNTFSPLCSEQECTSIIHTITLLTATDICYEHFDLWQMQTQAINLHDKLILGYGDAQIRENLGNGKKISSLNEFEDC